EAQPSWQQPLVTAWPTNALGHSYCTSRVVADIAAVADPNTGVAVYDSYDGLDWAVFGGTSVASPIIAGVYALAGNAATVTGQYAKYLYDHASPSTVYDVTEGSNFTPDLVCGPLCTGREGYDGPTGLGTPH